MRINLIQFLLILLIIMIGCSKDESNPVDSAKNNGGAISGNLLIDEHFSSDISEIKLAIYETQSDLQVRSVYKSEYCDQEGSFLFDSLSEGNYYLDAWKDLDGDSKVSEFDYYNIFTESNLDSSPKSIKVTNGELTKIDFNFSSNSKIPLDPKELTPPNISAFDSTVVPTFSLEKKSEVVLLTIHGLFYPDTYRAISLNYNTDNPSESNVFLSQNGNYKGLYLLSLSESIQSKGIKADLVFLVDNSGSMGDEADMVANTFPSFSATIIGNGIDAQFGCVGYNGQINGALNLTSNSEFQNYLNGSYGTERTKGFAGADATTLESVASSFAPQVNGENGVVGVLFALNNFNWRTGTLKVFINFTDEPSQPSSDGGFSIQEIKENYIGQIIIHTVFSDSPANYDYLWGEYYQKPWIMSEYTGGIINFINSSATGVSLNDFSISNALTSSQNIAFLKGDLQEKERLIELIIKSADAEGVSSQLVDY